MCIKDRQAKQTTKGPAKLRDDNGLPVVELDAFVTSLTELQGNLHVEAKVDISTLPDFNSLKNRREIADKIAAFISSKLSYRFT